MEMGLVVCFACEEFLGSLVMAAVEIEIMPMDYRLGLVSAGEKGGVFAVEAFPTCWNSGQDTTVRPGSLEYFLGLRQCC
jgi:hypothetical protein